MVHLNVNTLLSGGESVRPPLPIATVELGVGPYCRPEYMGFRYLYCCSRGED